MRLFVAIQLSAAVREHLQRVQDAMRSVAREAGWARPGNPHLTLRFLGEVPGSRLPEVVKALAGASSDKSLQMQAIEPVYFPPRGRVRIVGARLDGGEALMALQERIEAACAELGFRREGRAYVPHVTLARARAPLGDPLRGKLTAASADLWPGPVQTVEQFTLMESTLDPRGAIYTPAAKFPA